MDVRHWFYDTIYRLGRPIWDVPTPPELIAVVEGQSALPPGRALDLGCGTSPNVAYLAQHGWQATGVNFSHPEITFFRNALAMLVTHFDRLGRCEPAATIAGFAVSPLTIATIPEANPAIAHLREVLGGQTYESLARKGETITTAAMVTYAYDQIDQARTELEQPS